MKVLLISLFHPELVRGGAQQVCYELFQGLNETAGVEPILLATVDPTFTAFYKSGARITGFDGRDGEHLFLSRDYDYWWHKTSDTVLRESFAEFLDLVQPDVVHFHHFLLLGLDMLTLTRRTLPNAKIILTFHEFLAICNANGQMVRTTDRSLCDRASSVRCHQCFPERRPEEFFMRNLWVKSHLRAVDVFTTPSRFMIEHYVTFGLERASLVQVPNGQADYAKAYAPPPAPETRNRFGFFGQFVDNKGLAVLLDAVDLLREEGFDDFFVEVNGDNIAYASEERRTAFEAFFAKEAARPAAERRVQLNGSYQAEQIGERMARIDWCVVPSTWWEIFGMVISEAWMFKKPVIASNVGGPAERITHEVDGLLFSMGDPRALALLMKRACLEVGLWERLSAGVEAPLSRSAMTQMYLEVYSRPRL